jgi:hypothetical protein
MTSDADMIMADTGCTVDEAGLVEDIMRNEVFHSTLDWQSRAEFRRGAKKAWRIYQEDPEAYKAFRAQVQAAFWASRTGQELADSGQTPGR